MIRLVAIFLLNPKNLRKLLYIVVDGIEVTSSSDERLLKFFANASWSTSESLIFHFLGRKINPEVLRALNSSLFALHLISSVFKSLV